MSWLESLLVGLAGLDGGMVVDGAMEARGDFGERWAVYILVHIWTTGRISVGVRSARVRLWEGEKVIT
jgi:hypothetical protein